ncbi:Hypothetical predicted protein [Pelobates cultripes]|uniref:PH domain-containing protein n=1 Tax=Pelobates cultripes TaxID=61616 RepID=A0AAD1R980_PELCU|nr:Hypothetical predicted protein [Pelobates cultripes]
MAQSHKAEKEWPVKNLLIYLGAKKKIRPPTGFVFTIIYENDRNERSQWYACCDTVADMREWYAAFIHVQHGSLWREQTSITRTRPSQLDSMFGSMSLIPIRGSENDIRRSVAAFNTDPLIGNV